MHTAYVSRARPKPPRCTPSRLRLRAHRAWKHHNADIFLNDTGARVPIYGAPYERASPGCSGAPGVACCSGQGYELQRDGVQHSVFRMFVSRTNGTYIRDGTMPQNWRGEALQLSVRSGSFTGTAAWPNVFFQSQASASEPSLRADVAMELETAGASFQDVVSGLIANYLLMVPSDDPGAPGFVVPTASYPESAPALNTGAWAACRSSCSAGAAVSCLPQIGAAPYGSQRSATTASVIAAAWNALNRPVTKACSVLGNGQRALINPDLSPGPVTAVQYVSCDYKGTALVPIISLPRQLIDAGNTPPPSPPPPSPPLPPSPSPRPGAPPAPMPALPPPPTPAKAPPTQLTPPPPPPGGLQGPAVAFIATLPTYTLDSFDASAQDAYAAALQKAALGATTVPAVRIRAVTSASSSSTARRLLKAGGVVVDTVVQFAPTDTTASLILLTALRNKPSAVLPPTQVGTSPQPLRDRSDPALSIISHLLGLA